MPLIKRKIEKLRSNHFREQFTQVWNSVFAIPTDNYKDGYVRQIIWDLKRYMHTLVGDIKESPKDRLGIDEKILNARLGAIESVVLAIGTKDKKRISEEYEKQLQYIRYGKIPFSNLKSYMKSTINNRDSFFHESSSSDESSSSEEDERASIPQEFLCPISHEIMRDPVTTAAGHSYDRKYIEDWLKTNDTDPLTNTILIYKKLTPNWTLKKLIDGFMEKNPKFKDDDSSSSKEDDTNVVRP